MALLVGRGGSVGFPGKNTYPVLKRPLMTYPLMAALNSKYTDEIYVSTDDEDIKNVAKKFKGVNIIDRPQELATSTAMIEDAFVHGYKHVKNNLQKDIEFIVILMCNAPMVLPSVIDNAVETLRNNNNLDSVITVSDYSMFTPIRARKINDSGCLEPMIDLKTFNFKIDSNRQKAHPVYFHDCGASIVRPKCLENIYEGLLPQKWMGKRISPIVQKGALDIDYKYELPIAEGWLKENGFTEEKLPY